MSTTSVGREAEDLVASELKTNGHKIVAMNWRTRWCEIDIVSRTRDCVYFTEVKYRSSGDFGSGFDYIGFKKLKQMKFAAESWLVQNNWTKEATLQAAEVDSNFKIKIIELFD